MSPLHQSHKQCNRFHTTALIASMLLLLLLLCLSLFGSDGVLLMLFAFGLLVLFLPVWLLSDVMLPWLAIVLLLLAPLASTLLQLALSRTREFDADLDAAELTGDPATLATALMKIEQSHDKWWFLLLPSRHSENPAWTRTHPSTAERVRRLRALAAEQYRRHDRSSGFISPGSLLMLPVHRLGIWY